MVDAIVDMRWRRSEQVLLKVPRNSSWLTNRDNRSLCYPCCVFQFKPTKASAAEPTTTTKPQGRGGDAGAKGTITGPTPQGAGGGRGGHVVALHHVLYNYPAPGDYCSSPRLTNLAQGRGPAECQAHL